MITKVENRTLRVWVKHQYGNLNGNLGIKSQRRITTCKIEDIDTKEVLCEFHAVCHKKDQFVRRLGSIKAVHGAFKNFLGVHEKVILRRVMQEWKTQGRRKKVTNDQA